jgi:hypothetical protein
MANGDPDKVVRISLNSAGLPIPAENRVKVKKGTQILRWCSDFPFSIQFTGAGDVSSKPSGGDCAHNVKAGPFNQSAGTVLKYSIRGNGQLNDPEVEIEP